MKDTYGVDGIMLGRATIGYPWIFNEIKHYFKTGKMQPEPTLTQRIAVCKKHLLASIDWKGEHYGIIEMRRHYTNYFKGFPNFKIFRARLVTSYSLVEILDILKEVQEYYSKGIRVAA